ncbi:MAG: bifunctional indole-3-glycerol phosphate synthase/phosphoribosylanthranilate isomerase [Planctomycetota bacterium]|jgi:indole-3-glycerol phosphate synthase/phosphoribosylanthranilate isomerase|nr:bifunctional indole-3-glycerol phosphate synthase/phosphoribosylanthranilate isomerase [Planctomycetota bacterium]
MSGNIRDEIVERRRARIAQTGRDEGAALPAARDVPVVPFLGESGLICEVKRRSPSRGVIAGGLDAVRQAGTYLSAGAKNLSVLTAPEGFDGCLDDLRRVKRAFPGAAVLRKDFLVDEEDIDVSFRAGADAVLLIAGMLPAERLASMHARAKALGMEALLEIHGRGDLEKARPVRPALVGVNSRDLETFAVDPLAPLITRSAIDWPARAVYESGVSFPEQAAFAVSSGFAGVLVGEAVVRDPGLVARLLGAMAAAVRSAFWPGIAARLAEAEGRPLVKICGLTREDDARRAAESGADVLGFVFWERARRPADPSVVRALRDVGLPKAAVTVNARGRTGLDPRVRELLEEGFLDAVQLHGDEAPDDCARLWPAYCKAFRPASVADLGKADAYRCPRLLLDASAEDPGGTGVRVGERVLDAWKRPLWLAGGLSPENVGAIVGRRRPELVDAASGVEDAPGVKNMDRVRRFIAGAKNAARRD